MITTRFRTVGVASAVVAGGLLLVGLSGCGAFNPDDYPVDGPTVSATSNPAEVSKSTFGHTWNLTVDRGSVSCETNDSGDPALRFTAPDGTVYALNAVDANKDLPDIQEISDGSIGALRSFAFSVCEA